MAVFAEEIEGLLEVVASEGVADTSGAEDDFCGLVGGHDDDRMLMVLRFKVLDL